MHLMLAIIPLSLHQIGLKSSLLRVYFFLVPCGWCLGLLPFHGFSFKVNYLAQGLQVCMHQYRTLDPWFVLALFIRLYYIDYYSIYLLYLLYIPYSI